MILFKEKYDDYVLRVICKIIIAFLPLGGSLYLSGIFKEYFTEYYQSDIGKFFLRIKSYFE